MGMTQFPQAFLERMRAMLGSEYGEFWAALNGEPQRGLRLNPRREGYAGAWTQRVPWEEDGRYVAQDFRPGQDLAHFAGAYYMQDPSAMAPARVLDVQRGEVVLDLCAAPGGKSGQLGAALGGAGALVSNEPDFGRAKALSGNIERLGIANALVTCAYPEALSARWAGLFDAILVDAPCSGEGMFRRDEGARAAWSEHSAAGCAQRQAQILREAAKMLKAGGRLCYSTCTFNETENERTIEGFLRAHGDFAPVEFSLDGAGDSAGGMLRLWPHKLRGEGHFVALLRKRGDAEGSVAPRREGDSPAVARAMQMLERAVPGDWGRLIEGWRLEMRGDLLCAMPPEMPSSEGIRVLRAGLHLCRAAERYVQPDHALAMAAGAGLVSQSVALSAREALRFAMGEPVECGQEEAGWAIAVCEGGSIGWGKAVSGTLKNHVPKGVRLKGLAAP